MTSLGMFSLTSVRAFGAKVLAILGMNGNNFLPDMQTYTEALTNACLQQSSLRAKKILKSYSSAKTFSLPCSVLAVYQ